MSLDASLKAANALIRHRNVLTRDERLAKLKEEEKWTEAKSVFGLPKVAHRQRALPQPRPRRRPRKVKSRGGPPCPPWISGGAPVCSDCCNMPSFECGGLLRNGLGGHGGPPLQNALPLRLHFVASIGR